MSKKVKILIGVLVVLLLISVTMNIVQICSGHGSKADVEQVSEDGENTGGDKE